LTAVPDQERTFSYDVAVIGAGYVGVPLAATFASAGRRVLLVDIQPDVVKSLNEGRSHIEDVPSETLAELTGSGRIVATTGRCGTQLQS